MILYTLYMFILAFLYILLKNSIKFLLDFFLKLDFFFLFLPLLLIKIQFKFEFQINRVSKLFNIIFFFGQFFSPPPPSIRAWKLKKNNPVIHGAIILFFSGTYAEKIEFS